MRFNIGLSLVIVCLLMFQQSMSSVGVAAQQALIIPSAVESGIPTHPHLGGTSGAMMGQGSLEYMAAAGSGVNFASAPEMLIAINRLNDTIDSLRAEIVSLKSQVQKLFHFPGLFSLLFQSSF